jgi:hypothetical protein
MKILNNIHLDNWHTELTERIAMMEENGDGTLELGDGVYEISRPLRLPLSVSLDMTPNAVLRAHKGFEGDTVLIKGGGKRTFSDTSGWIRGGIIDGGKQRLTGIRVENLHRLEISDILVYNALYKGIHLLEGGNEKNLTRVRCDVDMHTRCAPGSIGIHYENGDSKVIMAHVIGYETGLRSDCYSNWFNLIHVWNRESEQGPMLINFYCNGDNNTFNQCYADSPTIAGFYIEKPNQSFFQNRVYYSRWAADDSGTGFLITPQGEHGTYVGNVLFAAEGHRLAKAFEGNLEGSTIIGTSTWRTLDGLQNRIASGECIPDDEKKDGYHSPLAFGGKGLRLTPQTRAPSPEEGVPGEIRLFDDGKRSPVLYIKTPVGWKKSTLN